MKLVTPDVAYKESYLRALQEEEFADDTNGAAVNISGNSSDFATYVEELKNRANGEGLPSGYVPDTILWLVEGDEYIGRVNIRHTLTDKLLVMGGHIGYRIRPSRRLQGYGKKILELALPEAKKLGLDRVLLTCDETNIGSMKIIEANGGVFEDKRPNPDGGPDKLRYWISIQ